MSSQSRLTKKDRPPALDIDNSDSQHLAPPPSLADAERSSSTGSGGSSLDPYYFSVVDPNPATPDPALNVAPSTPARDPASIDRRGLVGVGDLTTPRWANREGDFGEWRTNTTNQDEPELPSHASDEESDPGSPWTIEAIDGEGDGDDVEEVQPLLSQQSPIQERVIRPRPSMTEESGGEEVLYPRVQAISETREAEYNPRGQDLKESLSSVTVSSSSPEMLSAPVPEPNSPPTAFVSQPKAKKRTSDEFLMDSASGTLISKSASLKAESGTTTTTSSPVTVRKHRSLNVSAVTSSRLKDRRRGPSGGAILDLDVLSSSKPQNLVGSRHVRHASASASSSSSDGRRALNHGHADFSHLPPSPSSSSIQQFLRVNPNPIPISAVASASSASQTTGTSFSAPSPAVPSAAHIHTSERASVAHSLLRGTQEGWFALDDQETMEALRKLDGISGKTVHARASMSFGKSNSRPGTPGRGAAGSQWEGIESKDKIKRQSSSSTRVTDEARRSSAGSGKDRDHDTYKDVPVDIQEIPTRPVGNADELSLHAIPSMNSGRPVRPPGSKDGPPNGRASLIAKRGSASSTTFTGTPTTSSRDSTTYSASTSATSAISARSSFSKNRRNSGGSDASSIHSSEATSLRDRGPSFTNAAAENAEDDTVPPVPPLPKDIASYKSSPATTTQSPIVSMLSGSSMAPIAVAISSEEVDKAFSTSIPSKPGPLPLPIRSPSKKWSFSALNLLQSSSSRDLRQAAASPPERPISFAYTTDSGGYPDPPFSAAPSSREVPWVHPSSENETLTARSSMSSLRVPLSPASTSPAGFRDRSPSLSSARTPDRPGTASSASTHTTGQPPVSPRHGHRLTPSAIPFFRRSSSNSLYQPPHVPSSFPPASNPQSSGQPGSPRVPVKEVAQTSLSPSTKKSVFGLSLLKGSSSRKSLQAQADKDREREEKREKQQEKEREKQQKKEDDKDRSESRISVLMGRRRGKTLSSTDQKKTKVVPLPPMQMSAIPPATAQRVANLKSGAPSPTASTPVTARTSSSRVTASTVSSLNKQAEPARSSRHPLPTIAGSPSASTNGSQSNQSSISSQSTLTKETPTKIPRMASRSSTVRSPNTLKTSSAAAGSRRTSLNLSTYNPPTDAQGSMDEFGVLDSSENNGGGQAPSSTARVSVRTSPQPISRMPRTVANTLTSTGLPRKSTRESISFGGLRKASTGSIAMPPPSQPEQPTTTTTRTNRLSMLSPSKSLKLLSPKLSSAVSKSTVASSTSTLFKTASAASSRQSLSSPSPAPTAVDEEELLGDEEMVASIKRQHAKRLANGAKQEDLDALLKFPEPTKPLPARSPNVVLNSLAQYLVPFEQQEILDYPSVYYVGQGSKKKQATLEVTTNNHGYDDDRGDYIVIPRDHLAYRYEIVDTLGKGSFGQVLNCRDHATGQSVAIKIIRNKKRFHHQALVEIKILESLKKWDPEEKHHVIKMTEHFYFRNHLCIAMELLSINLYELIKANEFDGFTTNLIRRFTSQMLFSLVLMRQHRIVHCDLKPENILLRHPTKSGIKVIDFGSSCFEHEKVYTYIQSRFYRSPEVILGMNYHTAIDMWSLGCILAELYTGYPIFPGENEQEQLSCIMEVLGLPDKDLVNRSSRKRLFFDQNGTPRPVINSKGRRRRPGTRPLAGVLKCDDELFVDFVSKCLVWDPERRLKPQPALRHPFVTQPRTRLSKGSSQTPSKSLLSSSSSTLSSSSRSTSKVTETPKKSQIGAPTPLTARATRAPTTSVPQTPVSSGVLHSLGPRYRTSVSSSHQSPRYATATVAK